MSTIKANTIQNLAGTKSVQVDDISGYPLSSAWDGTILDETTTPKLSEVGIVGASPQAKAYPDGSIKGSSDNGNFTKHPNGDLLITGTAVVSSTNPAGNVFTGTLSITYPIALLDSVGFSSGGSLDTSNVISASVQYTTTTTGLALMTSNQSLPSRTTQYFIIGRWK